MRSCRDLAGSLQTGIAMLGAVTATGIAWMQAVGTDGLGLSQECDGLELVGGTFRLGLVTTLFFGGPLLGWRASAYPFFPAGIGTWYARLAAGSRRKWGSGEFLNALRN